VDATALAKSLLEPIPAHRTARIKVVRAVDGVSAATLDTPPALTNVIGSLHSSGLTALADATGLAALMSLCKQEEDFDGVLPLGSSSTMNFNAPARGPLTGTCELAEEDCRLLRALFAGYRDRARIQTTTLIVDGAGTHVATGTFTWSVRRFAR
jgi:acyl-coenzyme A thioesterase PaaI-like protein